MTKTSRRSVLRAGLFAGAASVFSRPFAGVAEAAAASTPTPRLRRDVATLDLNGPELTAFRTAVTAMRTLPADDPRNCCSGSTLRNAWRTVSLARSHRATLAHPGLDGCSRRAPPRPPSPVQTTCVAPWPSRHPQYRRQPRGARGLWEDRHVQPAVQVPGRTSRRTGLNRLRRGETLPWHGAAATDDQEACLCDRWATCAMSAYGDGDWLRFMPCPPMIATIFE